MLSTSHYQTPEMLPQCHYLALGHFSTIRRENHLCLCVKLKIRVHRSEEMIWNEPRIQTLLLIQHMDMLIGGIHIPRFYEFSTCTPPQPGQPQDHKPIHYTVVWSVSSGILGMNGEIVTTLLVSPCITKEHVYYMYV